MTVTVTSVMSGRKRANYPAQLNRILITGSGTKQTLIAAGAAGTVIKVWAYELNYAAGGTVEFFSSAGSDTSLTGTQTWNAGETRSALNPIAPIQNQGRGFPVMQTNVDESLKVTVSTGSLVGWIEYEQSTP